MKFIDYKNNEVLRDLYRCILEFTTTTKTKEKCLEKTDFPISSFNRFLQMYNKNNKPNFDKFKIIVTTKPERKERIRKNTQDNDNLDDFLNKNKKKENNLDDFLNKQKNEDNNLDDFLNKPKNISGGFLIDNSLNNKKYKTLDIGVNNTSLDTDINYFKQRK